MTKSAIISGNREADARVLEAMLRHTPFEFVINNDHQVDVFSPGQRYTYAEGQSIAVKFTNSGWVLL